MLGLRGWTEENKPEWRIPVEYFRNALAALPGGAGKKYLVLTDDAEYAASVVAELGLEGGGAGSDAAVEVLVGNRSWESIAAQYDKAMQCDHFILNYSTFHLWPALFAGGSSSREKVIVYPKMDVMTSIELEVYTGARFVSIEVPGTFRPFS